MDKKKDENAAHSTRIYRIWKRLMKKVEDEKRNVVHASRAPSSCENIWNIIKHYFILHIEMDEALSGAWWYGMVWCVDVVFSQSILMLSMFAFHLIQFWLVLFILLSLRRLYSMVFYVLFFSFFLPQNDAAKLLQSNEPTSTTHITAFMPEKW